MKNGNGNGGVRAAKWLAASALATSIIGNTTIYLDGRAARADVRAAVVEARTERHERVQREDQFFLSQCHRDGVFSLVIREALKDAIRRAEASLPPHSEARAQAVGSIQSSIDQLRVLAGSCKSSIPD